MDALNLKNHSTKKNVGRLRFELRTSRLKAGCSTAELATHLENRVHMKLSLFKVKKTTFYLKLNNRKTILNL